MTHEEATNNHPDGENSKPSAERESRLYSTGADDDGVFASLKLFVAKLNPSWTTFFQYPNVSKRDKGRHRLVHKQTTWCWRRTEG